MCGIIGYKGFRNASEIVINGLKELEYRGYDSWGISIISEGGITLKKKVGKISDYVENNLEKSNIAIGHTRWATHGGVTEENAHPHISCDRNISVVHNGIIENYKELKEQLKHHNFISETDTEVIVHLVEEFCNKGLDLTEAVKETVKLLKGRYAFLIIDKEGNMIAARKGSPLIIGIGEKEYFVASDIPAFLEYTNKVMYLDDNQIVTINGKPRFFDFNTNEIIDKKIIEIEWEVKQAEKGNHKHFMIKEIMEQKESIRNAVEQNEQSIMKVADMINNAKGIFFVGCGTAGRVCLTAEYFFSKIARKHVNSVVGSEFKNYEPFLTDKTLLISISQSGETADVLEALEVARDKSVNIISILNVFGSSMMRGSDYSLMINAGPEKAVASTKATTAQLAICMLLSYATINKLKEGKELLIEVAGKVNDMLNPGYEEHIKKLCEKIYKKENIYIIGRGLNYPLALESAIKIQEVSYIHAEGFAGGELKHGPIALIDKGVPCIVLVAEDNTKEDILSNAMEIKARGGYVIGVAAKNYDVFDDWIKVPDVGDASPIVNIIPIQILSYHLAIQKGFNPDMPRNLAKSVTVK